MTEKCNYCTRGLITSHTDSQGNVYLLYATKLVKISTDCRFVVESAIFNDGTMDIEGWDFCIDEQSSTIIIICEGLYLNIVNISDLTVNENYSGYLNTTPTPSPKARVLTSVITIFPGQPTFLLDYQQDWFFTGFEAPTKKNLRSFPVKGLESSKAADATLQESGPCRINNPIWFNDYRNGVVLYITQPGKFSLNIGASYIRDFADDGAVNWCTTNIPLPECLYGKQINVYSAVNDNEQNVLYFTMGPELTLVKMDYNFILNSQIIVAPPVK